MVATLAAPAQHLDGTGSDRAIRPAAGVLPYAEDTKSISLVLDMEFVHDWVTVALSGESWHGAELTTADRDREVVGR